MGALALALAPGDLLWQSEQIVAPFQHCRPGKLLPHGIMSHMSLYLLHINNAGAVVSV